MSDYQKCSNLTSSDIYDKNFNKTVTYACEMLKSFDNLNIKDLLNKILFPVDKNITYSDIVFKNVKDTKVASLISTSIPDEYYLYDVEVLLNLVRINYTKLVFGEIYILYNKINEVLRLIEQKEVDTCSLRKLNANINHLITIIGKDKNSGLINDLNIILENKNLKYCYGLRNLREKLSLMYDDLAMCKKDNKFNVDKLNYEFIRMTLKDSPLSYCNAIYLYYLNVKYPSEDIKKIEKSITNNKKENKENKQEPDTDDDKDDNDGPNIGAIIGVTVGGVVFLIIIFIIIYFYFKKNKTSATPTKS
jgi:hypothetical protein